tara:strand:- start:802 stop:1038 length:237 start_codon:yes stop_codon:yes gene_type:complete
MSLPKRVSELPEATAIATTDTFLSYVPTLPSNVEQTRQLYYNDLKNFAVQTFVIDGGVDGGNARSDNDFMMEFDGGVG